MVACTVMIHNVYFMSGVTIGFEAKINTVTEGPDSKVELCAVLLKGTLERQVTVMFITSDGSATSEG